jgi:hypothetical protein
MKTSVQPDTSFRSDRFSMIAQKGQPTPCRIRVSGSSLHPARYGSLGEMKAWLEQFSMNMRRSPGRVLSTMPKISSRTCFEILFLPDCFLALEMRFPYMRKAARCQRTTVSGATIRRKRFQAGQNRRRDVSRSKL